MEDTEEYFPRGGKKPTTQHFKQNANFLGAPERGEKKKRKPKKKSDTDDGYLSDEETNDLHQSIINCAIGLRYKTAKPGLLVLGRVHKVGETKISVVLPGRLLGTVMACHISEPYNKLLEAYVNDQIEKLTELPEMFRPGQYVAVKVLEVKPSYTLLSMVPQHLYEDKKLEELHKGCIIQAAVSSVEDHGFVMDIGIPNTRAFLPAKNTNQELQLDVGMLTWCCVKSVTPDPGSAIVTLTNHLEALQKSVLKKSSHKLLPGTAVDVTVDQPLNNGIEGHIFNGVTCYIQRAHADTVKGKKPTLGQQVRARILYVMPTTKTPFLTMKNIFETTFPDMEAEKKYQQGDIIDDAQVIKVSGRCIVFKLGRDSLGFMCAKRVQVHEDLTDEEVLTKSYPIGSTHKVRVLFYNLCDYNYSVTDEPAVVNEKYFNVAQLAVGQFVEARVRHVEESYIVLDVGRVQGTVPQAHLSESGIFVDPKKPTKKLPKKFKVGQAVKARVLTVDVNKPSVFFTLKPSLLAPELVVLKSYEEAELGKQYVGVIKSIRQYIFVAFFNDVVAIVPRQYVSRDPIHNLEEIFHIGQIVNCTIVKVDPEAKRMTGSFTTAPFTPSERRQKPGKRKRSEITDENEPDRKKKSRTNAEETDSGAEQEKHVSERKKKKKTSQSEDTDADDSQKNIQKEKKENRKKKREKKISQTEDTEEEIDLKKNTNKPKENSKKKKEKNLSQSEEDSNKKNKKKRDKKMSGTTEECDIKHEEKQKKRKEIKVVESLEPALEVPSAKEFWSSNEKVEKPLEEESSSSDEEEKDQPKKKRKRLTVAEKVAKAREEEERVREMERRAIESEAQPRSSEQFERALLANPDCSQLWIAYMAFHLQATEIEKARAVGRKALKTISFREEQEKLNVWLALLNCEHRFGTKESQQKTLEEALQMNDTFQIHSKLLDILVETGKHQELASIVDHMMRKYKRDEKTYVLCGGACYKVGLVEKARQVMQKAIAVLEKKQHVSILVQFALMERDSGGRERAEALFEQVLAVYPQRVDVCCVYLDMMLKAGDVENARQVLERMTSQKLPARKMKTLFKKWIEMEEKAGDEARAEAIRQRALDYVDKAKF